MISTVDIATEEAGIYLLGPSTFGISVAVGSRDELGIVSSCGWVMDFPSTRLAWRSELVATACLRFMYWMLWSRFGDLIALGQPQEGPNRDRLFEDVA